MNTAKRTALALLLALSAVGCRATSENYRAGVREFYPVVAGRMERYPLTDAERAGVKALRDATKDVRYEVARPAWEAVEPDYRVRVGGDLALDPFVKQEWLGTASLLDELQEAEAEYRRERGMGD